MKDATDSLTRPEVVIKCDIQKLVGWSGLFSKNPVKMSRYHDVMIPWFQDCKMSWCQDIMMSWWHDVKMSRCQDIMMSWWQDDMMSRFQDVQPSSAKLGAYNLIFWLAMTPFTMNGMLFWKFQKPSLTSTSIFLSWYLYCIMWGEQSIKLMWILLMQSQIYPTEPGHSASRGDIMIADNSAHTK